MLRLHFCGIERSHYFLLYLRLLLVFDVHLVWNVKFESLCYDRNVHFR